MDLISIWAKTHQDGTAGWHPLVLHLLDVAVSADAIMAREPETSRIRLAECLGMRWVDARPWLLLVVACHDLGKACPGFQAKWAEAPTTALRMPRNPNIGINHAFVSQIVLSELLQEARWPDELAELVADAVGCHHGSRASEKEKDVAYKEIDVGRGERLEAVRNDWVRVRRSIFDVLLGVPHGRGNELRATLLICGAVQCSPTKALQPTKGN